MNLPVSTTGFFYGLQPLAVTQTRHLQPHQPFNIIQPSFGGVQLVMGGTPKCLQMSGLYRENPWKSQL